MMTARKHITSSYGSRRAVTTLLGALLLLTATGCADTFGALKDFLSNRPPKILSLTSPTEGLGDEELIPGMSIRIVAEVKDPDGDDLTYDFDEPVDESGLRLGLFGNPQFTETGAEITLILNEDYRSGLETNVTVRVKDHLGKSATQTLELGSGRTSPVITVLNENLSTHFKSTAERTIRWQADQNGLYQVRLIPPDAQCTLDDSQPVLNYTIDEDGTAPIIESTYYGREVPNAPNNILSVGENRICIALRDLLEQVGRETIDFYVDDFPDVTRPTPTAGYHNSAQQIELTCDAIGVSDCISTIYTVATGGSTPDDPEFDTDGNVLVGQLYTGPISAPSGATATTTIIKYRSLDRAGNLEAVHTDTFIVDIDPTSLSIVNVGSDILSLGASNPDSTQLTWNTNSAGLTYKVLVDGGDCSDGGAQISSGANAQGTSVAGNQNSTILASDLNFGPNTIRVCMDRTGGGDWIYSQYTIDRVEKARFTATTSNETERDAVLNIEVTLTGDLPHPVTVDYAVNSNSTATGNGDDYTLTGNGTLTFAAFEVSRNITIFLDDDLFLENDETIILDLSSPNNVTLGNKATHTITIEDNEGTQGVQLTLDSSSMDEDPGGDTDVVVTASIDSLSATDITANLDFGGTAVKNTHFQIQGGGPDKITIPAFSTSATMTLESLNNAVDEPNRTIIVSIDSVDGGVEQGQQSKTITIVDEDYDPRLYDFSLSSSSADESSVHTVEVRLNQVAELDVQIPFTVNGSSTATGGGADYTISASPVTIAQGTNTVDITITVLTEGAQELDETIIIELGDPSVDGGPNGFLNGGGNTSHTVTIVDIDRVGPQILDVLYCDIDLDGRLDHARLEFSKDLDDSTMDGFNGDDELHLTTLSNWDIAGYDNVRLDTRNSIPGMTAGNPCYPGSNGDVTDDEYLWLAFDEISDGSDTGATPDLTAADTTLKDSQVGCLVGTDNVSCLVASAADINTTDVAETDAAGPVITEVRAKAGAENLSVTFSEEVDGNSTAGCQMDTLTTGNFSYISNNGLSGLTPASITGLVDRNACNTGPYIVIETDGTAASLGDLGVDTLSLQSSVADMAGNNAPTTVPVFLSAAPTLTAHFSVGGIQQAKSGFIVDKVSGLTLDIQDSLLVADYANRPAGAILLTGSSTLSFATPPELSYAGGQVTVSAWVKSDYDVVVQTIIAKGPDGDGDDFVFNISPGLYGLSSAIGGGTEVQGVTTPRTPTDVGNWVHAAAVFDGTHYRIYINGYEQASIADNDAPLLAKTTLPWVIGAKANNTERFYGGMDDIRIYNYALTDSDIQFISAPVNEGLVGFYPLDGGDTSDAANDNNAVDQIDAETTSSLGVDGIGGHGTRFSGNGSEITVPQSADYSLGNQSWTLAAWINPDTTGENHTVASTVNGSSSNGKKIIFRTQSSNDKLRCEINGGTPLRSQSAIPSGEWTHVACSFNKITGVRKIFVNGLLEASDKPSVVLSGNGPIAIGATRGENYDFDGRMDNFRIFNRALETNEVNAIYYLEGQFNNPVAYYPLNIDPFDFSGNNYHLSASGGYNIFATNRLNTIGGALEFDGTNARLSLPFTAELNEANFTAMAWARSTGPNDSGNPQAVISSRGDAPSGDEMGYNIYYNNTPDRWEFWTGNMSALCGGIDIIWCKSFDTYNRPQENWTHLTGTYSTDDSTQRFYVNGDETDSTVSNTVKNTSGSSFFIGAGAVAGNTFFFNGSIDDVRIFDRTLAEGEIRYLSGDYQSGIEAWFLFNGEVLDVSPNNMPTSGSSAPSFAADRFGNAGGAAEFDGSNYQALSGGQPVDAMLTELTIAGWLRLESYVPDAGIWHRFDSGGTAECLSFGLSANNGKRLEYRAGLTLPDYSPYVRSSTAIDLGEWTHVAVTSDGSTATLYIDGVEDASGAVNTDCATGDNSIIGRNAMRGNLNLDGRLDDLRVYNRELSPDEIRFLFEQ